METSAASPTPQGDARRSGGPGATLPASQRAACEQRANRDEQLTWRAGAGFNERTRVASPRPVLEATVGRAEGRERRRVVVRSGGQTGTAGGLRRTGRCNATQTASRRPGADGGSRDSRRGRRCSRGRRSVSRWTEAEAGGLEGGGYTAQVWVNAPGGTGTWGHPSLSAKRGVSAAAACTWESGVQSPPTAPG